MCPLCLLVHLYYWASLVAQLIKNPSAIQENLVQFLSQKFPWRRDRLPTLVPLGLPGDSDGKESACNSGHLGSIPGLGRSPGGEHGHPLQYSYLENPHEERSLAGYSPWGRKESGTTERLSTAHNVVLENNSCQKIFKTTISLNFISEYHSECKVWQT